MLIYGGFLGFPHSCMNPCMVDRQEVFHASVPGLCYTGGMSHTHRKSISKDQWDDAAAAYELGYKHAAQIARELGISAATVSREFKRRGCVKACRVAEFVSALEAELDAKAEREAGRREAVAAERAAAIDRLMDLLMKTVVAADNSGGLAAIRPEIDRIGKLLDDRVA